jgi:hypothetical protein
LALAVWGLSYDLAYTLTETEAAPLFVSYLKRLSLESKFSLGILSFKQQNQVGAETDLTALQSLGMGIF